MFYNDHNPPHFHARYGEYEIKVFLETGVVSGEFPRRGLALVMEWYQLHQNELWENWHLLKQRRPLKKIAPLE